MASIGTNLLQIVEAVSLLRLGFGLGQRGQEQRRQDGDDRDHHQKFDQCERGACVAAPLDLPNSLGG